MISSIASVVEDGEGFSPAQQQQQGTSKEPLKKKLKPQGCRDDENINNLNKNKEEQQRGDDVLLLSDIDLLLLSDVNDALYEILSVTSSDDDQRLDGFEIVGGCDSSGDDDDDKKDEEENDDNDDDLFHNGMARLLPLQPQQQQEQRRTVTVTGTQLELIRNLERSIRQTLENQHEKAQKGIRMALTGDSNRRVRDAAKSRIRQTSHRMKHRVRKVVTGDAEKPFHEWIQESHIVKTIDKFSFVVGVSILLLTELMVLQYPHYFDMYYCYLISIMMLLRVYWYAFSNEKQNYGYFLLDFCYFANLTCFVSVLIGPDSERLWNLNFALSNGTLLGALVAWKNSLVFHSLDKVTSIAIHFLPSLLTSIQRWSTRAMTASSQPCLSTHVAIIDYIPTIVDSLLFYIGWQILYITKTEIIDRKRLKEDPSIQTSLRWLTSKKAEKNTMHVLVKRTCRSIGVMGKNEKFNPDTIKTKTIFWIFQLIFTIITLIPTPFLFANYTANVSYILLVLFIAVYNGSNYYFEVFAA